MKRPNFLFIMTDTQATNMVGCYSGKPLNTQNIDSLAAEGIRFNSAYTCSPVCMPAITPVTSANGISTVMTISALASVRRSGTLITGSMGRTTLAN